MRYPHTATIQRMTELDGKYVFGDVGMSECFLQPIDPESSQLFGITFSKGSVVYAPLSADIEEADKLLINGASYGVRGAQPRDYGKLAHKKFIVERT